jgi:cyanophycin synthetase
VPRGRLVRSEVEALAALREIGGPLAVKPGDGHHGRAITLNVIDENAMRTAFATAADYDRAGEVIVDEMYRGRDYRALVVAGRLVQRPSGVPQVSLEMGSARCAR